VSTSEVDTWRTVSFWTEKLTEVLIWSFLKIDVSSVMRIETQGLKNKVVKTQGLKMCLTLKLIISIDSSHWVLQELSYNKYWHASYSICVVAIFYAYTYNFYIIGYYNYISYLTCYGELPRESEPPFS
jgi:hypothetical protein